MDDLIIASWFRLVLIGLTLIVGLLMLIQTVRAWKHLAIGQKLWATGSFCLIIYVCDAAREAVAVDFPFRWRLVAWTFGVVAYFAYYLEPKRSKMRRFGGRVLDPHDPL